MRKEERAIAAKYGITVNCEKLERELLKINGVTGVEFDLNGFLDDLDEVIILVGYDWRMRYFLKLALEILKIAEQNDLHETEDRIENYGEHLYFVLRCGKSWKAKEA